MIPSETRQLVLAVVDDWDDIGAEVHRFERAPAGEWKLVGEPWQAVIGARGSAWGRGLHGEGPPDGATGPIKVEGDGKSPAGVFALGTAFGYAARPPSGARVPYTEVDASWVCVDDARSTHYNRVLDRDGVSLDWSSSEDMRRSDDLYRWVLVVEHNPKGVAGAGSCIFLHLWRGPDDGTAGCTAMPPPAMEAVLSWLDPSARPVFVLLPVTQRVRLGRAWGLPGAS